MKKVILLALIAGMTLISQQSIAQLELSATGGYVPGSTTMYTYNGYRLRIDGGGNFTVGLGYNTPMGVTAEFSYMRYSSTLKQDGGVVEVVEAQPINVEYYQLGGLKPFIDNDKFVPYGLFTLGATRFNPTEYNEDLWRFSIALGLGVKYFVTDNVGIKIQTRLLMPLYFGGVGIGCGIGTGGASCGGGAYMGSEMIQADFTGGVVLRFGDK